MPIRRSVSVTVVPVVTLSLALLSGCASSQPDNQLPRVTQNSGNLTAVPSVPQLVGQRTQLPVPAISPLAPSQTYIQGVSSDGQWILGRSSNPSSPSYVESVDGQKVLLPAAWGSDDVLYGETTNGDLILGSAAGGGGVRGVFSPQHGVVQTFPFPSDKNSHWTYSATPNSHGDWLTAESNFEGGAPGKKVWWDINGRPIPIQRGATVLQWSPNGDALLIMRSPSPGASVQSAQSTPEQLVLYELKSGSEIPLTGVFPYSDQPPEETGSPPAPVPDRALWVVLDRHYLAYHSMDALVVVDLDTHKQMQLASSIAGLNWEFVSPTEIMVLDNNSPVMYFYEIAHDKLTLVATVTLPSVSAYEAIGNGRMLVQESSGQIDMVSPSGRQVIVPTSVTPGWWWYNIVNHELYYQPSNNGSPVQEIWTVPVPKA